MTPQTFFRGLLAYDPQGIRSQKCCYTLIQRFSQLLGTGGVGATPPRRGFTPALRIQTARKVL